MLTDDVRTSSKQRTLGLRTDIQGIRAISLILIVFFHAELPPFHGGFIGPDVFFVISGFLISTHLMEGIAKHGGIRFAEFYARRARRLVPTALFVIVLTVIGALIWAPPLQLIDTFRAAIASALYVPNMWFALQETGYLTDQTPSLFLHYWTLGVEEQFYFVWPLLLFVLFRYLKSTRLRVAAMVALTLISFATCVFLTAFFQPWAFFTLPARAWAFGVGALAAFALLRGWRLSAIPAAIAAWIGLISLVVASLVLPSETSYPGYLAAIPILATALMVIGGATPSAAGPFALLSIKPMTFLGDISYSVYLVHWPLLQLPLAANGYSEALPVWERILLAIACVPAGWLLYRYVEQPGRRAAWLAKARPRRTGLLTAGATLSITALVFGAWAWTTPQKFSVDKTVAATQIAPGPVGTPFVPSNLEPTLPTAKRDFPDLYDIGCQNGPFSTDAAGCLMGDNPNAPLVALFGDSHAVQWLPALAKLADDGKIRLLSNTKAGCPAAVVHFVFPYYPTCADWRQAVIDRLNSDPPDMILVGNSDYGTRQRLQGDTPRQSATSGDTVDMKWREAVLTTLAKLPKKSRIALLANTPAPGIAPAVCLSTFLDDAGKCALSRDRSLDLPARAAEISAVQEVGGVYFDFTDYFCNQTTCPAIIGDTLVFADDNHINQTFSRGMADPMMANIEKLLAAPARM